MAYNFKNLNEVDRQDKPTENTTVMAFEAGQPKQIPASEFDGKGLVVDLRGYTKGPGLDTIMVSDINYDPIYEAITAGQNVVFQLHDEGLDLFSPPRRALVQPEAGFLVLLSMLNSDVVIQFTNGSYHTTA